MLFQPPTYDIETNEVYLKGNLQVKKVKNYSYLETKQKCIWFMSIITKINLLV